MTALYRLVLWVIFIAQFSGDMQCEETAGPSASSLRDFGRDDKLIE
jgi:hypothetical protein